MMPKRVFDVHSHLNPCRLGAENIKEIVGYHFLMTEMHSIGLPLKMSEKNNISVEEWIEGVSNYLPRIRTTSSYWMANSIMKDLYGLDLDELTVKNWKKFQQKIDERYKDKMWPWKILAEHCNIGRVITAVNYPNDFKFPDGLKIFEKGLEDLNHTFGSNLKPFENIEKQLGRTVSKPDDIREYIHNKVKHILNSGAVVIVVWIGRFIYRDVSEGKMVELLSSDERYKDIDNIVSFQLRELVEYILAKHQKMPIQFVIGAHATPGPYTNWPGRIFDLVNPDEFFSLQMFFDKYYKIKMSVLVSSSTFSRELDTLVRFTPNLSLSGTWLHTMFPNQIKKIFSDRFEFLPVDKINAFLSDAYAIEWVYGKLKLATTVINKVIKEKIKEGWWKKEYGDEIIDKIFWENPLRLFGD